MDFLNEYHLSGLVIGICTFLIIGLFHPIVVKAEYYWGTKCWWIFLLLGIGGIIASLYTENIMIASLLGVFAFSSFWTIKEIFEQEERVKKGWFWRSLVQAQAGPQTKRLIPNGIQPFLFADPPDITLLLLVDLLLF